MNRLWKICLRLMTFIRHSYEDKPIVNQQPEPPSQTMEDIHFNEEAAAAQRDIEALSMKSSSSTPSYTTSKTLLSREKLLRGQLP